MYITQLCVMCCDAMIIAIDGPAGSGKGAVAKMIDERLNFTRIDTGAMYRCIALKMLRNNIGLNDEKEITQLLENTEIKLRKKENELYVFLDGEDVSKLIRMPEVNNFVSSVSAIKQIRIKMVDMQRKMKGTNENIVMEGRDITTVVFPDADLKVYLTADISERARRRYIEMNEAGIETTYEDVLKSMEARDKNDMQKEMGALKIADDAIVIDNTYMTLEETFEEFQKLIKSKEI